MIIAIIVVIVLLRLSTLYVYEIYKCTRCANHRCRIEMYKEAFSNKIGRISQSENEEFEYRSVDIELIALNSKLSMGQ